MMMHAAGEASMKIRSHCRAMELWSGGDRSSRGGGLHNRAAAYRVQLQKPCKSDKPENL